MMSPKGGLEIFVSFVLILKVTAQEVVIVHPGQSARISCTVSVTSDTQGVAWVINNLGPYRLNAIRGGVLTGYTAALDSNNLIVENIMMNDVRDGSEYKCVIVPTQGIVTLADIIEESNSTTLHVAGLTNEGNEFFVGFIRNRFGRINEPERIDPVLWITTSESTPVSFNVSTIFGLLASGTATRGEVTYINIPIRFVVFNSSEDSATDSRFKGIYIKAENSKRITVFGQHEEAGSNDAYLALPIISLPAGRSYEYIAASIFGDTGTNQQAKDSVALIIGTENNTEIILEPSAIIYHPFSVIGIFVPGLPVNLRTVIIQGFQTFYLQVRGGDISGTRIIANKPISVFSGHECANVPLASEPCDVLIEQLQPIDTWGTEAVTVPLRPRSGDILKVFASQDFTTVNVTYTNISSGIFISDSFTIDRNGYRELGSTSTVATGAISDFALLQSDKPIAVFQFSRSFLTDDSVLSDPFMLSIPSLEQYRGSYAVAPAPFNETTIRDNFVTRSAYVNYTNIAVPAEYFNVSLITINNSPINSSEFRPIKRADGSIWGYGAQLLLDEGAQVIKHQNPNAGLLVTIYGFSNQQSWGCTGGTRLAPVGLFPTPSVSVTALNTQIVGQSLTLQCEVTTVRGITSRVDIVWSEGNRVLERTNRTTATRVSNSLVYTNSYTISQLSTTDDGRVIQCEVVIDSSPSVKASDSITLDVNGDVEVPTDVRATVLAPRSIQVTWTLSSSSDVTSYLILYTTTASYISMNNRNQSMPVDDTTSGILTDLEEGTTYTITVQAIASNNIRSNNSNAVTVTTYTAAPSSPPQNVIVRSINPSSLIVLWLPPPPVDHNGPITGYVIQYTRAGSSDIISVIVNSGTTLYTISGLVAYVDYSVSVAAMNVNGTGPYNNIEVERSGEDSLSAPTNVRATLLTPHSIQVTWTPSSSPDVTDYLISYTTTASYTSGGNMLVGNTNSGILINLEEGTTYIITVQATASNNIRSNNSNAVTVTTYTAAPSSPPQNVVVTSVDPASLMVSWQPPLAIDHNGMIIGYMINYTEVDTNVMMSVNINSGTTLTISGLRAVTEYSVVIAAINVNGTGSFSDAVNGISGDPIFNPMVTVTAPNTQTVGQSLTLQCEVTTVRGITSKVDIVWSSGGTELQRMDNVSSTMMSNSLVYTNSYTISQLSTTDDGRVIQCEVVINVNPEIVANDSITLDVTVPQSSIIISQSVDNPNVGDDLILTCTVTVASGVSSSLVRVSWNSQDSILPLSNISSTSINRSQYTRTITFSPLLSGNRGQYICLVSVNGFDEANNSNSTMVEVNGLPEVTVMPSNQSVELTHTARFNASVIGVKPFSYQWRYNGQNISGEMIDFLILKNLTQNNSGIYICIVMNQFGDSDSSSGSLTVTVTPPVIRTHPASRDIQLFTNFTNHTLTCEADGALSYTWERQNDVIPSDSTGVNTNTLTFINLQPADAGNYRCVATNASGSTASDYANITINVPAPRIIVQPMDITVPATQNATFVCVGQGYGFVDVSWSGNRRTLRERSIITTKITSDNITSMLTIFDARGRDEGTYRCRYNNSGGIRNGDRARLTIGIPPPVITSHPMDITVNNGSNVTFNCVSFSFAQVNYTWFKNGFMLSDDINIIISTNNDEDNDIYTTALMILDVQLSDNGMYVCSVTNREGTTSSNIAILSVIIPPVFTLHPESNVTNEMGRVELSCTATSIVSVMFQWEKFINNTWEPFTGSAKLIADSTTVSGTAYTSSIRSINILLSDEGSYRCKVNNSAGTNISDGATITVYGPPMIVFLLNDATVVEGESVSFVCEANNDLNATINVAIRWFGNNGQRLSHGNDRVNITNTMETGHNRTVISTLTIDPVIHQDDGQYRCEALNHHDLRIFRTTQLTVEFAPIVAIVTMDKINQSEVNVTLNNKLNLTCNVESYPPAMVHWVVNGEQVSDVASVMVNTSVRGAIDTYTCVAVNEVNGTNRSASNSIDVIIQAIPGVIPTDDITQPERTVTTVVIQWKEPNDYNAPITMYELDLCQKLLQDNCTSLNDYPLNITADEYTYASIVSYNITGLQPFISSSNPYQLTIRAINDIGPADFSEPVPIILVNRMEAAVQNLTLLSLNNSEVLAAWDVNLDLFELSFFNVSYFVKPEQRETKIVAVNTYQISDLIPGETYTVQVTAYYNGTPADTTEVTVTLDKIEASPPSINQLILPENDDDPVILTWTKPNLTDDNREFFHGYDVSSSRYLNNPALSGRKKRSIPATETQTVRLDPDETSYMFNIYCPYSSNMTFCPYSLYSFSVVSLFEFRGTPINTSDPMLSTIYHNSMSEAAPSDPPQELIASNIGIHEIEIRWKFPQFPNGVITGFTVYYNNSVQSVSTSNCVIETTSCSTTINNLVPFLPYTIEVSCSTRAGEGPRTNSISATSIGIIISPSGTIQGAMVGSPQVINCTVSTVSGVESSSVMISWMGPGGPITTTNGRVSIGSVSDDDNNMFTSSLQFTYLMEGDEGMYTCNVTILDTSGLQSVDLLSLTVPTPTIHVTVLGPQIVGQPLTLQCEVTTVRGITSRVDIEWRRGTRVLNTTAVIAETTMVNLPVYRDSYTISQLSTFDDGVIYECRVIVHAALPVRATNTIQLDLIVLPQIYIHPANLTVKVDNGSTSVTLTCMAYEASSYYWERETGDIPSNAVGINTNTLTLHNILPPDSDRYRCVAENEHGITYSNYAILTIEAFPPVVSILPEDEEQVMKGERVEFICSATGVGANGFVYQWFLNDLPIADQDTFTLIVRDVSENNTGDYQCFVRNQYDGIGRSEVTRLILDQLCSAVTVHYGAFNITWNETLAGITVEAPCEGHGLNGTVRRRCIIDDMWEEFFECFREETRMLLDQATNLSLSINDLNETERINKTSNIANLLVNITTPTQEPLFARDINLTVNIVSTLNNVTGTVIANLTVNDTFFEDTASIIDNLLSDTNRDSWEQLERTSPSTGQALVRGAEQVTKLLSETLTSDTTEAIKSRPNIVIKAERVSNDSVNEGYVFPDQNDNITAYDGGIAQLMISSRLLQNIGSKELIIASTIITNNSGLRLSSPGDEALLPRAPASPIFSLQIDPLPDLSALENNPIMMVFDVDPTAVLSEQRSVQNDNQIGGWSTEGVTVNRSNFNNTLVTCLTTHLTSFAVLVSIQDERPFLHLNLCIALALGLVVFIAGIENATSNEAACKFVAALLQYLFISAFCWMLCEGVMLYMMLITVFGNKFNNRHFFFILGWGPAIPIVAISVGIVHRHYGTDQYCWIKSDDGAIAAFIVPIVAIMLINCLFLVIPLKVIWQQKDRKQDSPNNNTVKSLLKAVIILLPLLGITWIIGILAVNNDTQVFAWTFAILNSLQGVFILILNVLRNKQVAREVRERYNYMRRGRVIRRLLSVRVSGNTSKSGISSSARGTQSTSDNKNISTTFETNTTDKDYSMEMTTKDKSELFDDSVDDQVKITTFKKLEGSIIEEYHVEVEDKDDEEKRSITEEESADIAAERNDGTAKNN